MQSLWSTFEPILKIIEQNQSVFFALNRVTCGPCLTRNQTSHHLPKEQING